MSYHRFIMNYQKLAKQFLARATWRSHVDAMLPAVAKVWITRKQRDFLMNLASRVDSQSSEDSLPWVDGYAVRIGYIDKRTGASVLIFSDFANK